MLCWKKKKLYNINTTFFFDTTFKCCNVVMLYYVVFSPTGFLEYFFSRFGDLKNEWHFLKKATFKCCCNSARLNQQNKSAPLEMITPNCVTLPGFEGRKSKLVITIVRSRSPSCPRRQKNQSCCFFSTEKITIHCKNISQPNIAQHGLTFGVQCCTANRIQIFKK